MNYSPSKRRKTSPISSVGVGEPTSQRRAASQDGDTPSFRKASFMSPTKASLARFHPNLLPPSSHSSIPRQAGNSLNEFLDLQNSTEPNTNGFVQVIPRGIGLVAGDVTLGDVLESDGQLSSERSRPRSTTPRRFPTPSRKPQSRPVADVRASPPEEALVGDEGLQQFRGTDYALHEDSEVPTSEVECADGATTIVLAPHLPVTPTRTVTQGAITGMGLDQDGEPSLPSTPIHLGLEKPPESPRGLCYHRSAEKLKKRGATSAKSSPLKQQSLISTESPLASNTSTRRLGPRLYIDHTPTPPLIEQEARKLTIRHEIAALEKEIQKLEDEMICQLVVAEMHDASGDAAKEISRRKKQLISKNTQTIRLRQDFKQIEPGDATLPKRLDRESSDQMFTGLALYVWSLEDQYTRC